MTPAVLVTTIEANDRELRACRAARRATEHGFVRDELDEEIARLTAERDRLEARFAALCDALA